MSDIPAAELRLHVTALDDDKTMFQGPNGPWWWEHRCHVSGSDPSTAPLVGLRIPDEDVAGPASVVGLVHCFRCSLSGSIVNGQWIEA